MRDAFLRVGSMRVASLRDVMPFYVLALCVMPLLCVLPFNVMPFSA